MSPDNAAQIDEAASLWLARRHSGVWSVSDQADLERWLGESTRHRVAYLRFERGWEKTARLKTLATSTQGDMPPPPGQWNLSPFFEGPATITRSPRRNAWLLSLAAGLVVAVCVGWLVSKGYGAREAAYSTPVGGMASVPMTDGSRIVLNTNTAVRVSVTPTARQVELDHGEAFFDVVKDPKRPFVVHAGAQRIIVLGTQFSVRREADDVRVIVTEGQVRLESAAGATAPTGAIGPGTVVSAKGKALLLQRHRPADVQDELSWRSGFLVFRDVTLAQAVDEFNRYSAKKIVIEEPQVAALRIAGSFPATDVEAFLRLLEKGYPLRVEHDDEAIALKGRAE